MNIYHGLLFASGHITDPKLAMSLARQDPAPEPVQVPARKQPRPRGQLRWLIEELTLLGGRPVSREHLDDLEEPFPPLHPCP